MDKKYKLVYVEWEDASACASWFNDEEINGWADGRNGMVKEVGWIIRDEEDYIILASRLGFGISDASSEYGLLQKIPKTWIRKREILKL